MKVQGTVFKYVNGNISGRFEALRIVGGYLFGHLTLTGERRRYWHANVNDLRPSVEIIQRLRRANGSAP